MTYLPIVPGARTVPPESAALESADLLARLIAVVAFGLAHLESHPRAYENPSGELLRTQILDEARRLFRAGAP